MRFRVSSRHRDPKRACRLRIFRPLRDEFSLHVGDTGKRFIAPDDVQRREAIVQKNRHTHGCSLRSTSSLHSRGNLGRGNGSDPSIYAKEAANVAISGRPACCRAATPLPLVGGGGVARAQAVRAAVDGRVSDVRKLVRQRFSVVAHRGPCSGPPDMHVLISSHHNPKGHLI